MSSVPVSGPGNSNLTVELVPSQPSQAPASAAQAALPAASTKTTKANFLEKFKDMGIDADQVESVTLKFKRSGGYESLDNVSPIQAISYSAKREGKDVEFYAFEVEYEIKAKTGAVSLAEETIYTNVQIPHGEFDPALSDDDLKGLLAQNETAKKLALNIATAYGLAYSRAYSKDPKYAKLLTKDIPYLIFGSMAKESQWDLSAKLHDHTFTNLSIFAAASETTPLLQVDMILRGAETDYVAEKYLRSPKQFLQEIQIALDGANYPNKLKQVEKLYSSKELLNLEEDDIKNYLRYAKMELQRMQERFEQLQKELNPAQPQGFMSRIKDRFKQDSSLKGMFKEASEAIGRRKYDKIKTAKKNYDQARQQASAPNAEKAALEALKKEADEFITSKTILLDALGQMNAIQDKLKMEKNKFENLNSPEIDEYKADLDKKIGENNKALDAITKKFKEADIFHPKVGGAKMGEQAEIAGASMVSPPANPVAGAHMQDA